MSLPCDVLPGDCRETLATLPDESVQCCVTSPPYFGLRDYGHGEQIGLEPSPAEYVEQLVAVFREVRRVLREDGVLWLNLGDSYAGGGTIGRNDTTPDALARRAEQYGTGTGSLVGNSGKRPAVVGLKAKDLLGIPWRVAFALQADGWYLRQDIIWHKPNPMPESVRDRCTKAHEYVFLMSKSERYFYDADAISEPAVYGGEQLGIVRGSKRRAESMGVSPRGNEKPGADADIPLNRNRRSVWSITSEPYPDAHFATFPTELPRLCILAGSRIGDTILDPFAGSGTTMQVAIELGRGTIGCELNPDYGRLIEKRLARTTIGLPFEAAA